MYDEFGNLKKKFRVKAQQTEAGQVLPGTGRAGWEVEELGMSDKDRSERSRDRREERESSKNRHRSRSCERGRGRERERDRDYNYERDREYGRERDRDRHRLVENLLVKHDEDLLKVRMSDIFLHCDKSLMPENPSARSACNFLRTVDKKICLTCWFNVLQIPDTRDDAVNGMAWMRGETGDQGLNSLNFQSANMLLWMQQRVDPSFMIPTKIGRAIIETGTWNIFLWFSIDRCKTCFDILFGVLRLYFLDFSVL